jgi:4-amino-4-deoxy-L-arabinose transferase-like glycosyltransferase
VHVNIEIDKSRAHNLSILSEPHANQYYYFAPTTQAEDDMQNIVVHAQLRTIGYHKRLYIRTPEQDAAHTLSAIDNISIFIGNKLYYFSKDQVKAFESSRQGGYALFRIPNVYYEKSVLNAEWVNYYGDLNLALNLVCSFFLKPGDFVISYLFIIGLLALYRRNIGNAYRRVREGLGRQAGVILLGLLVALGFVLRVNGYVRESACSDEIYCAITAGNPALPFISTFADPGNPPFYFMVLRSWFKVFGWSEESGTMLSVVLGTLSIPALYLLVKRNFDGRAAALAAFFMAISGFALVFSQLMRAYVVLLFLAPVASLLFLKFLRRESLKNLALYILPSVCLASAHHYGILFVMAHFVFYLVFNLIRGSFRVKPTAVFLAGNVVAALFCLPYFLYQMIVGRYYFDRSFALDLDYTLILALIAALSAVAFLCRKAIEAHLAPFGKKGVFFCYTVFMPAAMFALAYVISIKKPMLHYRYWLPISYPFFIALIALLISFFSVNKRAKHLTVFAVWAFSLSAYGSKPLRLGADYEYYREARAYIAADADAHGESAAMLDNLPIAASYYGFDALPSFLEAPFAGVLYVFNGLAEMHEQRMYDELARHGLDDSGLLKIIPNERIAIFKKVMRP